MAVDAFDPLGMAIGDFWAGERSAKVLIHSDVGKDEELPAQYFFRAWPEMPLVEQAALELCRPSVLDIGAGAGSHSLILQGRGMEVCSLDISPAACDVMRGRGLTNVACGDIFQLQAGRFDTLLLLMNGIGIVGDLTGLGKFLERAAGLVRPGGQILLDSTDARFAGAGQPARQRPGGRYLGEVHFRMEYKGILGEPFAWLFVDSAVLNRYAARAGWECEVVQYAPRGQYLARLTRREESRCLRPSRSSRP